MTCPDRCNCVTSKTLPAPGTKPALLPIAVPDPVSLLGHALAPTTRAVSGPGVYGGKPLLITLSEVVRGNVRDIAARAVGVSPASVQRAKTVMDASPEGFKRLRDGESTVNTEYEKVRKTSEPRPTPKRESTATGKRAAINQNAQKQRMGGGLTGAGRAAAVAGRALKRPASMRATSPGAKALAVPDDSGTTDPVFVCQLLCHISRSVTLALRGNRSSFQVVLRASPQPACRRAGWWTR